MKTIEIDLTKGAKETPKINLTQPGTQYAVKVCTAPLVVGRMTVTFEDADKPQEPNHVRDE